MADIRLSKVPSGTNQTIACTPDSRFVFDFSTDEATMTRSGDNLVFTFDDGGSVELTGFYTTYNSEEMPDFEVDGTTISGADFFTAMNEPDLMPAAGPATVTVADGARYHEYANSSLLGGIDHLGGLDLGFDRAEEPENDLYGLGMDGGNAPLSAENYGGNIPSAEPEPSVPGNPDDNQNHNVTITPETPDPEVPGDPSNPSTQGASVTVHESGLTNGTQAGATDAPITAKGELDITAPDGVKAIELSFGGQTVAVNTDGTPLTLDTGEGTLSVSYANGKLSYEYSLDRNATHTSDNDTLARDITVKVTDTDGDSATSTIRVNVVDDAPKAENDAADALTRDADITETTGNVVANDSFGADGQHATASLTWDVGGFGSNATSHDNGGYTVATDYGTLTLAADGSYTFTLDNNSEALIQLKDGSATIEVPYTITDADGDTSDATLTLTVNGNNHDITVTPGTDPSDPAFQGANLTVYESGLTNGTQAGTTDAPITAKGGLDITAPDGVKAIELSFGGQTVAVNTDGTPLTLDTGEGTLSVSYANGKLSYEYSLDRNATHTSDNDTLARDITVKVTDGNGDTAESAIHVNIVDDAPTIEVIPGTSQMVDDEGSVFAKIVFSKPEGNEAFYRHPESNDSQAIIETQGIKFISTFVKYEYETDSDGLHHVKSVEDVTSNIKGTYGLQDNKYGGKQLWITENGLTVGTSVDGVNWNGTEIGMAPYPDDNYEHNLGGGNSELVSGKNLAEAVVIESSTNTVSYGMAIDFGSIDSTDRVVVSFYFTPQHNNDNMLVKQFEVDFEAVQTGTSHKYFDVPEGFTKVIVSPIPDSDGGNSSGFTIQSIELTKPIWVETGNVKVEAGADGLAEGSLDWDWAYYTEGGKVEIVESRNKGTYGVELKKISEGVWEGKLSGEGELKGQTLFIATLNKETGEWEVKQFLKFELPDGQEPFAFAVADTDGDSATDSMAFDIEGRLERFDDVDTGYYNPKWGSDAGKDKAVDVMAGKEGNDLMYGKGGDDIISGDGGVDAIEAIGKVVFQYDDFTKVFTDFATNDGYDANGNIKPGWSNIELVQQRLEQAIKGKGDLAWVKPGITPENFANKLAEIEKEHPDWNGNDALFGGRGDDILFGWGGDDYLNGGEGSDMIFAGGGDDLILYDKSDYLVHGGSGIDFLLSGKDGNLHLNDILKNTDTSKGPLVQGVEVLLKGDAVVTLTSLKELEDYGIKVDGDKLMLGEGWRLDGQHYTYKDGSLILETTLTGIEQDNGTFVFENANPSQIDELFSEDPYAIPDEALTFAALSSADQNKSRAFFPEDGDASQQGEEPVQGEYSGYMGAAEGKGAESSDDGLFEMSGSPASPLEEHTDALSLNDDVIGLEESGNMDDLLGVSGQPDAMKQEPDERSLELTNLDTSAYSGLDMERGENAAGADSPMPVADGMDPGICHGIETTEDHANEEALRAAITAMQADTGGC